MSIINKNGIFVMQFRHFRWMFYIFNFLHDFLCCYFFSYVLLVVTCLIFLQ